MNQTTIPPGIPDSIAARIAEARTWIAAPEQFAARFRLFFEDAPIGMAVGDAQGQILEVNRALCILLGYERQEMLGRDFRALSHPDDRAREAAALARVLDGPGDAYEIEKRFHRRDGQVVHALLRGTVLRDARGGVRWGIAQIVDITARKRAEEALRESEQRFRGLFDDAPLGMWVQGLDGRILQVNEALCAITGRSAETLLRAGLEAILHPDDAEPSRHLMELIKGGALRTHQLEERYLRLDGRTIWVHRSVSAVIDDQGKALYVLNQAQDVTAAREAREAALREPLERFRIAFAEAPIGMALVGTDGRFLRVNRAFCQITGYTDEEMRAHSFADLTHPEDLERDTDALAGFLAGNIDTYVTEKRYVGKDGRVAWVQLHVSSVNDPEDRLLYFISQAVDITARKRAEQVLWEGEERFRVAFEEAPIGMALVSPAGRFLRLNRTFCDLLGRVEGDLLRTDMAGVAEDDEGEALVGVCERMAAGSLGRHQAEVRFRGPGDTTLWGLLILSVVRDRRGRATYFIAQLQDVGQRHHAESALRESEARFRRLVESTRAIPWEYDCVQRRFTYVGPQMAALLGVTEEACRGEGFWESRIHPDDREEVVATCSGSTARGEDHELEYRMRAADGRTLWVHDIVSVVSEEDRPRSLRGFLIDVTARRQLEAKLRHAQKLEAVGRMAGGIAHDYDNLLTAILGYSDLLVAAAGDLTRLEGYVEQIQRSGRRAAALTQQLLALRRRSGSPEPIDRAPGETSRERSDPAETQPAPPHLADNPRRP